MDSLESLRSRLAQVSHSLHLLNAQLQPDLPPPPALHAQFLVLLSQLHSLAAALHAQQPVLEGMLAHPTPAFPLREHENLLTTLLRKKPSPQVEAWRARGDLAARRTGEKEKEKEEEDKEEKDRERWNARWEWAAQLVVEKQTQRPWNARQTKEEIDADGHEQGEGEGASEAEEMDQAPADMAAVLRFMSSGRQ